MFAEGIRGSDEAQRAAQDVHSEETLRLLLIIMPSDNDKSIGRDVSCWESVRPTVCRSDESSSIRPSP